MTSVPISGKRKRGNGESNSEQSGKRALTTKALEDLQRALPPSTNSCNEYIRSWTDDFSSAGPPKMSSLGSPTSTREKRKRGDPSTKEKTVSTARGGSTDGSDFARSIADPQVPQNLEDSGIKWPEDSDPPANLRQLEAELSRSRASLSPRSFDVNLEYKAFARLNAGLNSESAIMADVNSEITGGRRGYHGGANDLFDYLAPLTNPPISLPPPKPDYWDGERATSLDLQVRRELRALIQPMKSGRSILPTYSLEAKAPNGKSRDATTQALYDGAAGARAMHTLQNHRALQPDFHRQASTIAQTYCDGHLRTYSTHVQPLPGNRLEYHSHRLGGHDMLASAQQYKEGLTAVRNAREYCATQRSNAIHQANLRHHASLSAQQAASTGRAASDPLRTGQPPSPIPPLSRDPALSSMSLRGVGLTTPNTSCSPGSAKVAPHESAVARGGESSDEDGGE